MSELNSAAEPAAAGAEMEAPEVIYDQVPEDILDPPAADPAAPSDEAPAPVVSTSDDDVLANWRSKLSDEMRAMSDPQGQPSKTEKTADEPDEEPAKAPDAEHPDEEEKPPKKADDDKEPAKPEEKPKDKEPAKESEDDDDEAKAKDDDAPKTVIPQVAFKSRDEIEKEFDRIPKGARAMMAEYAEAGKQMQTVLDSLGGEAFMPPLLKISEGMQSEDNLPVFEGYLLGRGVEGLAKLVDDTMRFAMIEATQADKPDNDAGAFLQQELKASTNRVIQAMFGDDATIDHIQKLVRYDAAGHLNTADVDKYFEENPDADKSAPGPKDERIKALEDEVAALKGKPDTDTAKREAEITHDFETKLKTHSRGSLNDLVIKKSLLKAVDSDAPEIANFKTQMRELIEIAYDASITGNPLYTKLRAGAAKGESATANFQKRLTSVLDTAIMKARTAKEPIEALLASIMENTRNAKLLNREKKVPEGDDGTPKDPTQTKKSEKKPTEMSPDQWREHLRKEMGATAGA